MCAAEKGRDECVRFLLDERFGTDVNRKFEDYGQYNRDSGCRLWDQVYCDCGSCFIGTGRTALWLACYNGHLSVVRTLVEIGHADVNISDAKNCTPLRAAILRKHVQVVKYLIDQTEAIIDESHDLLEAIKINSNEIVEYLLNIGCDPNARLIDDDEYDPVCYDWNPIFSTFFPLHYAVVHMYEDCAIIKTILECGGDPTLLDDNGQTALHIAISLENLECVKTILQYGFTHDQRNKNSFTPLMEAAYYDKIEIVDLLFNTLPRQQYINEIMLLACYYQTSSSLGTRLTEQAFDCFQEALHLQSQISNSISCEAYEFRHECQTSDELIFIRNDEHAMLIQALLVYERLLPSRGEMHILVSILIGKMFQYYVQR
ncbi:unnamed protein product, partial [Rotaria sp. Silwood2]